MCSRPRYYLTQHFSFHTRRCRRWLAYSVSFPSSISRSLSFCGAIMPSIYLYPTTLYTILLYIYPLLPPSSYSAPSQNLFRLGSQSNLSVSSSLVVIILLFPLYLSLSHSGLHLVLILSTSHRFKTLSYSNMLPRPLMSSFFLDDVLFFVLKYTSRHHCTHTDRQTDTYTHSLPPQNNKNKNKK